MSWLIAGLGNPGPKYAGTRHNIGFMVVEELAAKVGASFRDKYKGRYAKGFLGREEVHLLMPQTFMNVSGTSVSACATFFKVPPERVLVIHDELDIDFGALRLKVGGGHAGHNGLRSIFAHYGKEFVRLRCGIGRPVHGDVANYVLSSFDSMERAELPDVVSAGVDAIERTLSDGITTAMNRVNTR